MNELFYTKRLIDLREKINISQKDLSQMLGLDNVVYGHYERGETIIPIKHLNILSNYFHVSLDYIFGFTNLLKYKNENKDINYRLQHLRLKELRKKSNLTQEKFANSIHAAKSTISDYETKDKPIATPFLYDICKKYNISADYLLGKIDNPKYLK